MVGGATKQLAATERKADPARVPGIDGWRWRKARECCDGEFVFVPLLHLHVFCVSENVRQIFACTWYPGMWYRLGLRMVRMVSGLWWPRRARGVHFRRKPFSRSLLHCARSSPVSPATWWMPRSRRVPLPKSAANRDLLAVYAIRTVHALCRGLIHAAPLYGRPDLMSQLLGIFRVLYKPGGLAVVACLVPPSSLEHFRSSCI